MEDQKRVCQKVVASGNRKDRQHCKITERQKQIQEEGVTYSAGIFDVL